METIKTRSVLINNIPSVIWGNDSEKVFIAVHGNLADKKDAIIADRAAVACPLGWQVLSFDLPGHGDRKVSGVSCHVREAVADLKNMIKFAARKWADISLVACSIGAYFGMLACQKEKRVRRCFMISPVTDMAALLSSMMKAVNVSAERLQKEKEIATPFGQSLYWDYYEYVIKHPIKTWKIPTSILCGAKDEICGIDMIREFADRFKAETLILKNSWHYIHTPKEMTVYRRWLSEHLNKNNGEPMKNLFTVDMKNYDRSWPRKERTAIRGIIVKNGKIAMIRSQKYGEYKFPGGGMKKNETDCDTLRREVLEETGMTIDPDSVKAFGSTLEIRRNFEEEETLYQTSKYYFCRTVGKKQPRHLDDYEADYGYEPEWVSAADAVKNNNAVINYDNIPWKKRDTAVLELLIKKQNGRRKPNM